MLFGYNPTWRLGLIIPWGYSVKHKSLKLNLKVIGFCERDEREILAGTHYFIWISDVLWYIDEICQFIEYPSIVSLNWFEYWTFQLISVKAVGGLHWHADKHIHIYYQQLYLTFFYWEYFLSQKCTIIMSLGTLSCDHE